MSERPSEIYLRMRKAIEWVSREVKQMKCCQNCIRSSSSTSSTALIYYCAAHRRYVNPTNCCPLHIPNNGYEEVNTDRGEAND